MFDRILIKRLGVLESEDMNILGDGSIQQSSKVVAESKLRFSNLAIATQINLARLVCSELGKTGYV